MIQKQRQKKDLKNQIKKQKRQLNLLGIDEVGRGSLAGPLVVGVVCLNTYIPGIKDSKLLTAVKRSKLSRQIIKKAEVAKLGWVSPTEIDSLGLTAAMRLAIKRALTGLDTREFKIVIDGGINYLKPLTNSSCQIKADETIYQVSAASIIAKVARDKYMKSMSYLYPEYNFDQNVGYGTKAHINAIKNTGLSDIHRLSFRLKEEVLNNL